MKVRMKTVSRGKVNADPDDVVDLSKKDAQELLDGGYAEPVGRQVETATEPQAEETAEATKPRKGGKKKRSGS